MGALYTVFRDRIEVEVKELPSKLSKPDSEAVGFSGSIHGRPRHEKDLSIAIMARSRNIRMVALTNDISQFPYPQPSSQEMRLNLEAEVFAK